MRPRVISCCLKKGNGCKIPSGLKTKLPIAAYAPIAPVEPHSHFSVSLPPTNAPRADRPKWFAFLRAGTRVVDLRRPFSARRLPRVESHLKGSRMIPTAALPLEASQTFPPLGKKIKALLVWPKIPNSFWAFGGMLELLPEKVVMPPLGLITVAALCPPEWTLRLVDEAVEDLPTPTSAGPTSSWWEGWRSRKRECTRFWSRARRLGRRTIVGGPYASSEPERMVVLADHVVVGEPDEVFGEIAAALEAGTAKRHYQDHR